MNVAFGYLSVFISYLCIDESIRDKVSASLKGQAFAQLLNSVEEFMHYHAQLDEAPPQGSPQGRFDNENKANFLHRLRSVVNDLRAKRS